jgi:hypothetical protein
VQRSFDGPTKAEDVRYVPILDALLPTMRAWRLRRSGRFVFPNRDGKMLLPSGRIFQEVLHRVSVEALDFDQAYARSIETSRGWRRPPSSTTVR